MTTLREQRAKAESVNELFEGSSLRLHMVKIQDMLLFLI